MSDVIVSTTESTTDVTTTNDVTTVAITNTVVEISQATAGLQGVPGSNSDPTYVFVTNKTGATLAKGSIVYVSGANGVHTQVSLALATGDVTSARTLGWLAEDIANNATGLCCVEGYLDGIDTQGVTEGAQLYLSPTTPGAFTETKPSAPDHMVYVGFCSKASAGNGRVFVFVQNGAELEELHDVKIVSPQNNDLLRYVSGTALWENVASTAITVGSAITAGTSVYATNAGTSVYASTAGTSVYATNAGTAVDLSGSITKSQVSDFTAGTVASASTAQQAGTAVYATTSGSASVAGSAVAYTGSITISQITDLANATVTSASTAQQAGTAVYALTSGTAEYATTSGTSVYATTSGTAVTITGSITRSQVSDFASGTVATITGSITRSQVSNFSSGTVAYATSAGFASEADTANNATNAVSANTALTAGTASYATTSGTAVTISGSITNSQVSDFASGTVANISGTVAQSQVTNLTTDLAGKANLAGGNSFTGAQVVASSGTAIIPIVVRGTAGQSANLLQIETASATAISVTSAGNLNATGQVRVGTTSGLGQLAVVSTGTATIGAVIRGASGQSANLLEIQNSGSTALSYIRSTGALYFNSNNNTTGIEFLGTSGTQYITANGNDFSLRPRFDTLFAPADTSGRFRPTNDNTSDLGTSGQRWKIVYSSGASIVNSGTALVPLTVRGASGQSANLQEWQNSGSTAIARVDKNGAVSANYFGPSATGLLGYLDWTTSSPLFQTGGTAVVGIRVRGAASQSANLQEWQTSSGSTAALISSAGTLRLTNITDTASTGSFLRFNAANLQVDTRTSTNTGLIISGVASQTGDLQTWTNAGAGTVFARVSASGQIASGGTAVAGPSFLGQITVIPASTATVGVVVQGLSGQSANLQNWNIDGGTIRASVDASGNVRGNSVRTLSDYTSLLESQAGGYVRLTRATATIANPGANLGNLYFVAGTNANTLKLVVRAGAAGAETTILDNIPT